MLAQVNFSIFQELGKLVSQYGLDTGIAVISFGFLVLLVWTYFNYVKGQLSKEHQSQNTELVRCEEIIQKEHEQILNSLDKINSELTSLAASIKTTINILIDKEFNGEQHGQEDHRTDEKKGK